jgi:hypothetical protein
MLVKGTGVVADPVPPVATVYHKRLFPAVAVAVSATAVSSLQYSTVLLTIGASGSGLTVIEKVCCELHKPLDAVTLIKAVNGVVPVLIGTKAEMLPVPLAAKPIDVLLLVQL